MIDVQHGCRWLGTRRLISIMGYVGAIGVLIYVAFPSPNRRTFGIVAGSLMFVASLPDVIALVRKPAAPGNDNSQSGVK